jgi:hypothetical protein
VVAWFASSEPRHFLPSSFPVFVLQDSEGYYYGFPEFGAPGGWAVWPHSWLSWCCGIALALAPEFDAPSWWPLTAVSAHLSSSAVMLQLCLSFLTVMYAIRCCSSCHASTELQAGLMLALTAHSMVCHVPAGFKIGVYHHLRQQVRPDDVSRELTEADVAALRAPVARYFPSADNALLQHSVCMFTNTPDGHFIIDRHPRHPQVCGAACAGAVSVALAGGVLWLRSCAALWVAVLVERLVHMRDVREWMAAAYKPELAATLASCMQDMMHGLKAGPEGQPNVTPAS